MALFFLQNENTSPKTPRLLLLSNLRKTGKRTSDENYLRPVLRFRRTLLFALLRGDEIISNQKP